MLFVYFIGCYPVCQCLSTLEDMPRVDRQLSVDLVVSGEDMSRLDMSNSVVSKMLVVVPMMVVVVPSWYMVVCMTYTRVRREMRSSSTGSNKAGEEESSEELHGFARSYDRV